MERGIYKITNPERKIYIGLSNNIKRRWKNYKNNSSMNGNSLLKTSFKTLEYSKHIFEIKELIQYDNSLTVKENNKILREREKYWINFYKSNIDGLNQNKGGCGPGKHNNESKQKISNALKNKPKPVDFGAKRKKWQHTDEFKNKAKSAPRCPVLMFDLKDNFIKEFPNQQAAADYIGAKKNAIWNFLNEHPNPNGKPLTQVKGFKFKYK
jgi:predicted GIY-YIG superfamily endonuclease